jgi:hypothetical protein
MVPSGCAGAGGSRRLRRVMRLSDVTVSARAGENVCTARATLRFS